MCPVAEKAKIEICESDQWIAGFISANFGLDGAVSAPCKKRGAHADLQFHGKVNITGEASLN